MIPKLQTYSLEFPSPHLANEDGIVAWGGDLNPSRLLRAYEMGIFPWYNNNDPIIWWSPNPRLIMELDDFRMTKSLQKSMKRFSYKIDSAFSEVMLACGTTRRRDQNGSWINPEMIEAYTTLHGMGRAHSIESYSEGKLAGGLYGVVVGRVFCGESMFAHVSDASKAAYALLIAHLKAWGYDFVDCQVPTNHLKSLGAIEIPRELFLKRLEASLFDTPNHIWSVDQNILC